MRAYDVVDAPIAEVDQPIPRIARPLAVHPRAEGEAIAAADNPRARDGVEIRVARAGEVKGPVEQAGR